MQVKLVKLQSLLKFAHPNGIEEGHVEEGEFRGSPVPGYPFWVGHFWSTTKVTKVLSDNTFRTLNSIYRWELIK